MTQMQMLAALVTSPRRAFEELEKNPKYALPMILTLVATLGVVIWFYASIDVDSLIDHTLRARGLNAAQRAQAASFMTRNTMMGSSLVGGALVIFVIQLVEAFYFYFMYEFLDVSRTYKQWFAFSWWSGLPQLIAAVATAVALLFHHSAPLVGVPSPLSLNELFFHFDPQDSGYAFLNSLTLVLPLSILLTVIGAHTWSKRSWALDTFVVILPRVVIYAVWGWFVFLR